MTDLDAARIDPEVVAQRLQRVHSRIEAAGGDPLMVQVLAVTKGFGSWAIRTALAAGLTQIGENYAQELVGKWGELPEELANQAEVHFIGRMQTNKVKLAASVVDVWQCLDRPSLAKEVAKRCPGAVTLLQLNVSGSPNQGGCPPTEADRLLATAAEAGLVVVGVMAIGPQGPPAEVRAGFELVRNFADKHQLPQRSIGMSGDLEHAVAAGSTMIRVGTALFGDRPPAR